MARKLPKWLDTLGRIFLDPYYGLDIAAPKKNTSERESTELTRSLFGSFESDITLGISDKDGDIYIPSRSTIS